MPKLVVDVFVLVSLFVPLLLAAGAAQESVSAQASLLEMDWKWQAAFAAALVLPVFGLRRLQLLRAPSRPPSIME